VVALLLGLPLDLDDWGGGGVARLPRETAQTARKRGAEISVPNCEYTSPVLMMVAL
jgi:hypothetical protein